MIEASIVILFIAGAILTGIYVLDGWEEPPQR